MVFFHFLGYNISKTHDFEDVDNNGKWAESYNGDGGFHQVFVGLGYKVFNNLSVGANFSYLYGDITHQSMTAIGATDTRSIKLDKFSISDYKLDFGLQYTYKLNKKNTINVGAVYTLGHTLHGDAYKYHQTGTESPFMYSHKLAILFQTRLKCHIHLVQVLLMYMTTA